MSRSKQSRKYQTLEQEKLRKGKNGRYAFGYELEEEENLPGDFDVEDLAEFEHLWRGSHRATIN